MGKQNKTPEVETILTHDDSSTSQEEPAGTVISDDLNGSDLDFSGITGTIIRDLDPSTSENIISVNPAEIDLSDSTLEIELDMSLDARFQRAKEALEDAIDAQNQINRLVNQRTKELDALILEKETANPTNSISEIQFYLTGSKRKREESASRRRRMLESVLDPAEIIRQLDPRSPIDRRPPVRKAPHGSVQHPGTKPQKTA